MNVPVARYVAPGAAGGNIHTKKRQQLVLLAIRW
jgi:hypothetical protein